MQRNMLCIYILFCYTYRVDDDQIPITASTALDIMPTSSVLKEQMQMKADSLYV